MDSSVYITVRKFEIQVILMRVTDFQLHVHGPLVLGVEAATYWGLLFIKGKPSCYKDDKFAQVLYNCHEFSVQQ